MRAAAGMRDRALSQPPLSFSLSILKVEAILDRGTERDDLPPIAWLAAQFEGLGYMSWAHRVVNAAGERTRERERFFFSSPPFFLTLARVHCRVGPTADRQGPANQIAIDALGSAPFQSCHTPSARQARAGWHRREKTDQKRRARARAQREGGAGGGRPFPRKPSSKKNSLLKKSHLAFGLPHRRRRTFIVASLHGDARDVLLAQGPTKCPGGCARTLGAPCFACHRPAGGDPFTVAFDLGNAQSPPCVDVIPTLKTTNMNIALLFPDASSALLSPGDAERLQGLPEGWTAACYPLVGPGGDRRPAPRDGDAERREAERWGQAGNAVAVPVARWLGTRLADPCRFKYVPSARDRPLTIGAAAPETDTPGRLLPGGPVTGGGGGPSHAAAAPLPDPPATYDPSAEACAAARAAAPPTDEYGEEGEWFACGDLTGEGARPGEATLCSLARLGGAVADVRAAIVAAAGGAVLPAAVAPPGRRPAGRAAAAAFPQAEAGVRILPSRAPGLPVERAGGAGGDDGGDDDNAPGLPGNGGGATGGAAPSHADDPEALAGAGGAAAAALGRPCPVTVAPPVPPSCDGLPPPPPPLCLTLTAAHAALSEAVAIGEARMAGLLPVEFQAVLAGEAGRAAARSARRSGRPLDRGRERGEGAAWPRAAWFVAGLGRHAADVGDAPVRRALIPLYRFLKGAGSGGGGEGGGGASAPPPPSSRRAPSGRRPVPPASMTTYLTRMREQGWDVTRTADRAKVCGALAGVPPDAFSLVFLPGAAAPDAVGEVVWARRPGAGGGGWWPAEALDPWRLPFSRSLPPGAVCAMPRPAEVEEGTAGGTARAAGGAGGSGPPLLPGEGAAAGDDADPLRLEGGGGNADEGGTPRTPGAAGGVPPPVAFGPKGTRTRSVLVVFFPGGGPALAPVWAVPAALVPFSDAAGSAAKAVVGRAKAAAASVGGGGGGAGAAPAPVAGRAAAAQAALSPLACFAAAFAAASDIQAAKEELAAIAAGAAGASLAADADAIRGAVGEAAAEVAGPAGVDPTASLAAAVHRVDCGARLAAQLQSRRAADAAALANELTRCGRCAACVPNNNGGGGGGGGGGGLGSPLPSSPGFSSGGRDRRCLAMRAAAAAAAGHAGAQLAALGESAVGADLAAWWPLDGAWYSGTVVGYDPYRLRHVLAYADGDVELVALWSPTVLVRVTSDPAGWAGRAAGVRAARGMVRDRLAEGGGVEAVGRAARARAGVAASAARARLRAGGLAPAAPPAGAAAGAVAILNAAAAAATAAAAPPPTHKFRPPPGGTDGGPASEGEVLRGVPLDAGGRPRGGAGAGLTRTRPAEAALPPPGGGRWAAAAPLAPAIAATLAAGRGGGSAPPPTTPPPHAATAARCARCVAAHKGKCGTTHSHSECEVRRSRCLAGLPLLPWVDRASGREAGAPGAALLAQYGLLLPPPPAPPLPLCGSRGGAGPSSPPGGPARPPLPALPIFATPAGPLLLSPRAQLQAQQQQLAAAEGAAAVAAADAAAAAAAASAGPPGLGRVVDTSAAGWDPAAPWRPAHRKPPSPAVRRATLSPGGGLPSFHSRVPPCVECGHRHSGGGMCRALARAAVLAAGGGGRGKGRGRGRGRGGGGRGRASGKRAREGEGGGEGADDAGAAAGSLLPFLPTPPGGYIIPAAAAVPAPPPPARTITRTGRSAGAVWRDALRTPLDAAGGGGRVGGEEGGAGPSQGGEGGDKRRRFDRGGSQSTGKCAACVSAKRGGCGEAGCIKACLRHGMGPAPGLVAAAAAVPPVTPVPAPVAQAEGSSERSSEGVVGVAGGSGDGGGGA